MSDFTYEATDVNVRYETYEWDNTWIDHANDQTAKRVGMQVCGVYDESSKDYVEQIKSATDYCIYHFAQLTEI